MLLMSSSTAVRGYTQEKRLKYPNCTRSSIYSANRPWDTTGSYHSQGIIIKLCFIMYLLALFTDTGLKKYF